MTKGRFSAARFVLVVASFAVVGGAVAFVVFLIVFLVTFRGYNDEPELQQQLGLECQHAVAV